MSECGQLTKIFGLHDSGNDRSGWRLLYNIL
jgi:hypothetical protein